MTRPKIERIRIEYDDGTGIVINTEYLEKLEALNEAVTLLERARYIYHNLEPLFGKKPE